MEDKIIYSKEKERGRKNERDKGKRKREERRKIEEEREERKVKIGKIQKEKRENLIRKVKIILRVVFLLVGLLYFSTFPFFKIIKHL